jgi:stage V sporulation protein AF
VEAKSLTMAQESLSEVIRPKQWYNPFPKVRYTERPDSAAASILEGNIVVMVDNSPSVMILPTTFFDFTQEANEFYFPPLIGSYLRILRIVVFLISLFITPVWYVMVSEEGRLPEWLQFLSSPEPASLSLLWQLLVVEFLIDVLKLSSLNTPDSLSNSFSVLGALILGDFAVQAGWLGPEVLVYMAFVSIAGFAQPSYELGYAFKLLRVVLLLLTAAFDFWGLGFGTVGILVLLATTKPLIGKSYLYPLIPFNGKALRRLLSREPIRPDNT